MPEEVGVFPNYSSINRKVSPSAALHNRLGYLSSRRYQILLVFPEVSDRNCLLYIFSVYYSSQLPHTFRHYRQENKHNGETNKDREANLLHLLCVESLLWVQRMKFLLTALPQIEKSPLPERACALSASLLTKTYIQIYMSGQSCQ